MLIPCKVALPLTDPVVDLSPPLTAADLSAFRAVKTDESYKTPQEPAYSPPGLLHRDGTE